LKASFVLPAGELLHILPDYCIDEKLYNIPEDVFEIGRCFVFIFWFSNYSAYFVSGSILGGKKYKVLLGAYFTVLSKVRIACGVCDKIKEAILLFLLLSYFHGHRKRQLKD
jgi:hypothetical protein